eukprot:Gregarina_sp_Poly_1__9193@NODE_565_length_7514_cov_163_080704_g444_i0_p1_GENE_NODE_565_length_7514_cov_163_080704_g444_i0NODE_565_length_7514_cov_163_080704_g444_i0_p1_ORF_typecomplete_len876_score130_89SAPS/PF04499_15/5_6e15_NODE_565_length_7514_cov_163_080704_g444_i017804407
MAHSLSLWRKEMQNTTTNENVQSKNDRRSSLDLSTGEGWIGFETSSFQNGSSISPGTTVCEFRAEDDLLIYQLLQHIGSEAVLEILRCLISVVPSEPLIACRPTILCHVVNQLGKAQPWDVDHILAIERSENVISIVAQILANASNIPEFEILFLNLISKPSISRILQVIGCGTSDLSKSACELLTMILGKCDELLATAESRKSLAIPCQSPSVSTPLMKPHGLLESRSPQLHPTADNAALDLVDTGLFTNHLPGQGSESLLQPHSLSEPNMLSPNFSSDSDCGQLQSEVRLSMRAITKIREFLAEVANDHLQQAVCRTLCPQVIAVRHYQRERHRRGERNFPGSRDHCRQGKPAAAGSEQRHLDFVSWEHTQMLAPHKRTSAEANTTPPNGLCKASEATSWECVATEETQYTWGDFSFMLSTAPEVSHRETESQETAHPPTAEVAATAPKLCVSNDTSESTTSGSSPPGAPGEEMEMEPGCRISETETPTQGMEAETETETATQGMETETTTHELMMPHMQQAASADEALVSSAHYRDPLCCDASHRNAFENNPPNLSQGLTEEESYTENQKTEQTPKKVMEDEMHHETIQIEDDRSDQLSAQDETASLVDEPIDKVELPQGIKPRVGSMCLAVVNVIHAVIRIRNPEAEAFACRFVPPLVDLFFAYKWNSLLHNSIKQVMLSVIEEAPCEPGSVLEVVLTETSLAHQIVKLAKRQKRIRLETNIAIRRVKRARHRVGYISQTFQIAEGLIMKCSRNPWLSDVLDGVPGWTKTVLSEVDYYVSLMSEPLGGNPRDQVTENFGSMREHLELHMPSRQTDNAYESAESESSSMTSEADEEEFSGDAGNPDTENHEPSRVVTLPPRHDVLFGVRAGY